MDAQSLIAEMRTKDRKEVSRHEVYCLKTLT